MRAYRKGHRRVNVGAILIRNIPPELHISIAKDALKRGKSKQQVCLEALMKFYFPNDRELQKEHYDSMLAQEILSRRKS